MELKQRVIRNLEWANKRLGLQGKELDETQLEIIEFCLLHDLQQLTIPRVSSHYLSAEKAKQMTLEALKEIAAKEYDTKCVLEQIEEATQNGAFEIQTYDNKKIRNNLVLLGYNCSEPFKSWNDVFMKVSWS